MFSRRRCCNSVVVDMAMAGRGFCGVVKCGTKETHGTHPVFQNASGDTGGIGSSPLNGPWVAMVADPGIAMPILGIVEIVGIVVVLPTCAIG